MIDLTIKSVVSWKEDINSEALDAMYAKISTQYHLSELGANSNERLEFGPLPGESLALLITLGVLWLGLATLAAIKYYLMQKTKDKA